MKPNDFARYLSNFFSSYLPGVRNVSINTIRSYRDTYRLLLFFCNNELKVPIEKLTLKSFTDKVIIRFLDWLEQERKSSVSTRNQRLAAIHAFFRYIQLEEPVLLFDCQKILSLPFKKFQKPIVNHLTAEALQLILQQPDVSSRKGRRDLVILSLLYDTGARVQELVDLRVRDVRLEPPPIVSLTGKGRKTRHVPLLMNTNRLLTAYMQEWNLQDHKSIDTPLFVNYQGMKMTRAGISYIVRKYSNTAYAQSEIIPKTITPHVFRHYAECRIMPNGFFNSLYYNKLSFSHSA